MNKTIKRLIIGFAILVLFFVFLVNQNAPNDSIHVRHDLPAAELQALDIDKWGTWKKEPSTFVWQFPELETIYVTKGEVYVTPDGSAQSVHIKQGDFATFAPGLRCVWRVTQPFEKQVILAETPLTSLYWRTVFKAKAAWRRIQSLY